MTFYSGKIFKNAVLTGCALSAIAMASPVAAQARETYEFDIKSKELGEALTEYGIAAGQQVLFKDADVRGKTAKELDGTYTPEEALRLLLEGTGVKYRVDDNGTLLVGNDFVRQSRLSSQAELRPFQVAQLDQTGSVSVPQPRVDNDEEEKEEVIVVTGTNIRGIAPESSPVLSFDRADILNSGASTAVEFIQTLTQNFGGGSIANTSFFVGDDINAAFNSQFNGGSIGTGVNLRGLGSGSTLVLLNGRRIAPSSAIGDFVDVSLIPASAIERVEVLTDGASSIYGGDAVAGVINFILRDDFDGIETTGRYGTVTNGNLDEFRTNITLGKNWGKGNGIFVYEFFDRDRLRAADRSFAVDVVQSLPDELMQSFTDDEILLSDLTPTQKRHSLLASVKHEFTPTLEVSADASFSTRTTLQSVRTPIQGADSEANVDNFNLGLGLDWDITDNWHLMFSGGFSTVSSSTESTPVDIGNLVSVELNSDVLAADLIASGSVFELPAGDVGVAVGVHFRKEDFSNFNVVFDRIDREADREVYALFGEANIPLVGPAQDIPGIHRLEVNVSGRFEDYSDFGSTFDPKVGVVWSPIKPLRLRGSYNTSFKPPSLGRVGANDLSAAAIPTSIVSLFTMTPAPDPSIANEVLLSLSGTDADLDPETSTSFTVGADFDQSWGDHSISLSATYFDIKFEGQLGNLPIPGNVSPLLAPFIAFSDPDAFPAGTVTFNASQAEVSSILDSLVNLGPFPGTNPEDASIISRALVTTNLVRTDVSGLDFSATYNYDLDPGVLTFGINGTYLIDFVRQASVNSPAIESLNTLFNPVDLNVRAQAGYSREGLSANLFMNYVDSYQTDTTTNAFDIDSWTTFDLNIAYDTSETITSGVLKNTVFRLSIINLFNQAPPLTPDDVARGGFGFDPTNANPTQRFMSFEITKKW
ncbi:MAG: TonB-dependent receptor [Pseudomonadota bacterium]